MRRMHCPCWNFPGLEQAFEFSDIFGLVAPRGGCCSKTASKSQWRSQVSPMF